VSWTAAAPSIGVESRICSAGPSEQAELGRELERALEDEPLLAVEEEPGAEANQRGRVKAGVVERQIERDLPAQIEANGVHRALIGESVAVGERQHLGEQAGRNRGPAVAL